MKKRFTQCIQRSRIRGIRAVLLQTRSASQTAPSSADRFEKVEAMIPCATA